MSARRLLVLEKLEEPALVVALQTAEQLQYLQCARLIRGWQQTDHRQQFDHD
jgi:hypothetical protein